MQDVDLFLSLAEIAGVFVGFGSLIAIRAGGTSDVYDVAYVGMVVWVGIQVVAASLIPVAISRFDVPGHALWLSCGLIVLALFWVGDSVVWRLSAERRALLAATPTKARAKYEVAAVPLWLPANIALGRHSTVASLPRTTTSWRDAPPRATRTGRPRRPAPGPDRPFAPRRCIGPRSS
jgi:hypothetical protein